MNKSLRLGLIADYSENRIKSENVSLDNYITIDNILQNKAGITKAINLPPNGDTMPEYNTGNILVGNIRPYLKKIWFADRDGGCSSDVLVFKVKKDNYPKFIYYALFRDDFFNHMMRGKKGTKMPRGDKDQILDFLIPDFSFNSQQKISSVLSSLDSKIAINNRINTELEKMAKTIYNYWFVQFDFPDESGKPYKTSGGKMVWNEKIKRNIPLSWIIENLKKNSLTKLIKPGILNFDGEKFYLATADVEDNKINIDVDKITYLKRETRANMQPVENSVWFAKMKNSKKVLFFGDYSIEFMNKYILSTGFAGLICKNYSLEYIWNFINNKYFEFIKDRLASGATQEAINNDSMAYINLIIPPDDILKNFHNQTYRIYNLIYVNQLENQKLIELRDWLLPMLMNGQVRVG